MSKILLYHNGECFVYKDVEQSSFVEGLLIFTTKDNEKHCTNMPFQVIHEKQT